MRNRKRKLAAVITAAALVTGGVVAGSAPATAAVGVYVDPNGVLVQDWEGWGTAMAWWADRIGTWPEAKRAEIADQLFSTTNGLGLNIIRYNLGGSADPNPVTQMRPGGAVPSYLQKDETTGVVSYDWTLDTGQRQMLDMAKARGADTFEAFVNSPPAFMTASGDPRGNPNCSTTDNIAPANYDAFVAYMVTVLKKYKNGSAVDGAGFGTEFDTISPYNEPDICWNSGGAGISEGNKLSAAAQSAILVKLDAALAAEGLDTEISGPETSNMNNLVSQWSALTPAAKAAVDQINVHEYGGTDRAGVRNTAVSAGKKLWMSEYGCCDGTGGDNHQLTNPGLWISQQISNDLNVMRPSAWVMWQVVEDEGIQQSYDITWGAIHADMAGSTYTHNQTKMFPFFRQYTNFIRPGSQIISTGDNNVVASYQPTTGKLSLVAVNNTGSAVNKSMNLGAFSTVGSSATAVRTSGTESFVSLSPVAVSNKQFTTTLPANSVTSYTVNVGAAAAPWNASTTYEIVAAHSNQRLGIAAGSTADGGQALQWTDTNGAEQGWNLQPTTDGYYKITNANSSKALSVSGESIANGGNIVQWTYGGGLHQQWKIVPTNDGGYAIVNRKSGKLLSISGESTNPGASAIQWTDGSGAHQRWTLVPR